MKDTAQFLLEDEFNFGFIPWPCLSDCGAPACDETSDEDDHADHGHDEKEGEIENDSSLVTVGASTLIGVAFVVLQL